MRTVVASKQSPHLLLPLTSFGLQGHKIPAEIQSRMSSDESAVYRPICDSSGQNKFHAWIASTSDHQALETDSTYNEFLHATDGQEKTPVMKRGTTGKQRRKVCEGARHRQTDTIRPKCTMNSLFCHSLTECKRTTVKFWVQQSEMMTDDTWPQAGEMRSLWKGTTEFWTNDMPQDDTWERHRHHSHILSLFRSHLTRNTAAMFPLFQNPVASTEHECRDLHSPVVSHTVEEEGRNVVLVGVAKILQCVQ